MALSERVPPGWPRDLCGTLTGVLWVGLGLGRGLGPLSSSCWGEGGVRSPEAGSKRDRTPPSAWGPAAQAS